MLSNNLSDLIHQGVAKYYTFCVGTTGSCRLPVPDDSFIVITDFTFHHFVDRNQLLPFDIQNALKNCVHHLRFKSQSDNYLYNIRSAFRMEFFDGIDFLMPLGESSVSYDTYQVHTTDVHIDIWRLTDFTAWMVEISKLANKTVEPAGPTGYGTVNNAPNQNVVRRVNPGGFGLQDYIPYGINQDLPLNAGWREQFFSDIDNQTLLFPPAVTSDDGNFTYPLLNIGYVLVKQPFVKHNK